jgi:hypothetical protein
MAGLAQRSFHPKRQAADIFPKFLNGIEVVLSGTDKSTAKADN